MTFTFSVNIASRGGEFDQVLAPSAEAYSVDYGDEKVCDTDGDDSIGEFFGFVDFCRESVARGVFAWKLFSGKARGGAYSFRAGQFE